MLSLLVNRWRFAFRTGAVQQEAGAEQFRQDPLQGSRWSGAGRDVVFGNYLHYKENEITKGMEKTKER